MSGARTKFDATINYYQILNVPHTANKAEITRAYKLLIRGTHPDRAQTDQERRTAEERTKLLNAAYAVLSKPDVRREYDQAIRQTALADTLMQRYTGNVPGRPSPFVVHRPVSAALAREQRRAARAALWHFVLITIIFVAVLIAFALASGLVAQGVHSLAR